MSAKNLPVPKISTGRVDINVLRAKVKKENQKENRKNLVFFSLFVALVVVFGIFIV